MQIYDMYVEARVPRAVLDSYTGITADTLANYILDVVPFPVFALCFSVMYFSLIFMVTTTVRRLKDQNIPLHKPFVDYLRLVCKADNQMF